MRPLPMLIRDSLEPPVSRYALDREMHGQPCWHLMPGFEVATLKGGNLSGASVSQVAEQAVAEAVARLRSTPGRA